MIEISLTFNRDVCLIFHSKLVKDEYRFVIHSRENENESYKYIKKMLPFLEEKDIQEIVKKINESENGEFEGGAIQDLLPYMNSVDEMFINSVNEGKDISIYLPFVSDEAFHELINGFLNGKYKVDLDGVYPFLPVNDLRLLLHHVFSKTNDEK